MLHKQLLPVLGDFQLGLLTIRTSLFSSYFHLNQQLLSLHSLGSQGLGFRTLGLRTLLSFSMLGLLTLLSFYTLNLSLGPYQILLCLGLGLHMAYYLH